MIAFMDTSITCWNCQGIRSKRKELELYLKENNFGIVALNETFLTKKVDFKIQGYDTIENDSSTGTRGAVAFLVKLVINKEYRNIDFNIIDKYADFIVTAISTAVDKAIPTFKSGRPESQPVSDQNTCAN